MNVDIGTVAAQILFYEYLFRISVLVLCSATGSQLPDPPYFSFRTIPSNTRFYNFVCFHIKSTYLYFVIILLLSILLNFRI
jgi:hypothetical protein